MAKEDLDELELEVSRVELVELCLRIRRANGEARHCRVGRMAVVGKGPAWQVLCSDSIIFITLRQTAVSAEIGVGLCDISARGVVIRGLPQQDPNAVQCRQRLIYYHIDFLSRHFASAQNSIDSVQFGELLSNVQIPHPLLQCSAIHVHGTDWTVQTRILSWRIWRCASSMHRDVVRRRVLPPCIARRPVVRT
jgi:hypothetical protein